MSEAAPVNSGVDDVLIFGHRGASADHVEHSRSAYAAALDEGADGVETDVRLTGDGTVVCWHDSTTDRVSGVPGTVHELTIDEMRSRMPGGPDELMTLQDLLSLLVSAGRPVRLALEIKQPSPAGAVLDDAVLALLERAGWDPSTGIIGSGPHPVTVDIMSFWPPTIAFVASRVGSGVAMLLLDADADPAIARSGLLSDIAVALGPGIEAVRADPSTARRWASERPVRVWTVNTSEDARFCLDLGIRQLTTDRPGALRSELGSAAG